VFISNENWMEKIIVNWKEVWKYENIKYFKFSPDSKEYAFIGRKKWKYYLVINSKENWPYNKIYDF